MSKIRFVFDLVVDVLFAFVALIGWLVLLSFLTSCEDVTFLHPIGGEDCAITVDGQTVVGEQATYITCHLGTLRIKKEGNEYKEFCIGSFLPSPEVCDLEEIDEDCDGIANDIYYSLTDYRNECDQTQLGVCKLSSFQCVSGVMECVPPHYFYGEEVCDGYDNNCNGLEDEDDPTLVLNGEEWVYNGPTGTLNVGECRAGQRQCRNGHEVLFGMRTPITEICANDDDDDCDGITDESEGDGVGAIDFALFIDDSGSMDAVKDSIKEALCIWGVSDTHPNSRFSITVFGLTTLGPGQNYTAVITDFTDAQTACDIYTTFLANDNGGGGIEYQLDSVINSHLPGTLLLDWGTNDRKAIVFTDEFIQSRYTTPVQYAVDSCQEHNYSISAFLSYGIPNYNEWQAITQNCGGFIEYLSPNSQEMIDKLNYIAGGEC